MKVKLKIVGKTEDGKIVIGNVFMFMTTYGIAMDTIFDTLNNNNMIPDWISLYTDSINEGWNERTFFTRLENSLCDIYGKEFSDYICNKLKGYE